nr:fatty acid desaturase 2.3 [Perilla frutescens]
MGAESRALPPPAGLKSGRAHHTKPPFTLAEIKKSIPPHCFRRSILRSFSYVAHDVAAASLLYYAAANYIHRLPRPLPHLAWPAYWFAQGCVFTGLWGIAHDCGHHAFSDIQAVDDGVGLILHSFLLVPYFSFKFSHRRHHSNTNSLDRDEVYVPKMKSEIHRSIKYLNNPIGRVIMLLIQLSIGFPLYLIFNASGRRYGRIANHFDPYSPIYKEGERAAVIISDAAILVVIHALCYLAGAKGVGWLLAVYGGPMVACNAFVGAITYLQHTHPSLPRYDSSEWEWLKATLSTVDRDYGRVLNEVFHHTADTHVVHHLFPTIPHYHAVEATAAVKPVLGEHYLFDEMPVVKALWRAAKECLYVEREEGGENKGVFWFNYKI